MRMKFSSKMVPFMILFLFKFITIESTKEFPIKEVFQQPSEVVQTNNNTFVFISSNHQYDKYLCTEDSTKCCSCNSGCMVTQSCCIDYLWDKSANITASSYINDFIKESKTYKDVTCQLPVRNTSFYGKSLTIVQSYFMVTGCMDTANEDDKQKCLDETSNKITITNPVLGEDDYIYRNSFCALCNNVSSFKLLQYYSRCSLKENVTSLTPNTTSLLFCSVSLLSQNNFTSFQNNFTSTDWECDIDIVDETRCSKDNQYHDLCNAFAGRIDHYGKYKNIFCYLCVHNDSSSYPTLSCKHTSNVPVTFSLSQTLGYGNRIENNNIHRYSKAYSCRKNEVYNFNTQLCEELECPLDQSKCIDQSSTKILNVSDISNTTNCYVYYNFLLIKMDKYTNATIFTEYFEQVNLTRNEIEIYTFSKFTYIQPSSRMQDKSLRSFVNLVFNNPKQNVSLYLTRDKQSLTEFYQQDNIRTFSNGSICADMTSSSVPVRNLAHCSIPIRNLAHCNTSSSTENETLWISIQNGGMYKVKSICERFHMTTKHCRQFGLNKEYKVNEDKTIGFHDITDTNIVLFVQQYVPVRNGIAYCIDGLKLKHKETIESLKEFEYYLSLTGSSLSIVCYIAVITTFTYFKKLHTLPNYNNIGICTMLLLSDLLFLIATQAGSDKDLCTALAVLLHYTLLSVQCWVLVISIDIALKMRNLKAGQKSMKIFRYYCVIALVTPLVVVVTLFVLDEKTVLSMGYGDNDFCWINNFLLRLTTYIIPALIVFVVTFMLLSYSIYKIKKIKDETSKVIGRNHHSDLIYITLKMVILLGLTEVVGFIQIQHDKLSSNEEIFNSSFSILYAFVRSFRGCFFAVMFLLNKRTYKLYRETVSSYASTRFTSSESSNNTTSNVSKI